MTRWLEWMRGVLPARAPTVVNVNLSPCPMTPEQRAAIDAEIDAVLARAEAAADRLEAMVERVEQIGRAA